MIAADRAGPRRPGGEARRDVTLLEAHRGGRLDEAAEALRSSDDPGLPAVLAVFGADPIAFLTERLHVLHEWDVEPPSEWLRHHLWEADRRNVFDVHDTDDRGRVADLGEAARARPRRPVPADRWTQPFNTVAEEDFLSACAEADAARLRAMLTHAPGLVRARTKWGMTAIYQVGAYGSEDGAANREAVSVLLAAGEPDPFDGLCGAARWGGDDVIFALLEAGVAPEDRVRGTTPLHLAAERGHDDVVALVALFLRSFDEHRGR